MKLLSIVGARPQFVKLAALARAFSLHGAIEHRIVHTGQHYDEGMSDVFFEEMDIPRPDVNLGIHAGAQGEMTGRMLQAIEPVLQREQPDVVIVYGDTNSTLAGALAAAKLHLRVAHVEAGLRSYNRRMPEEINRVLTDHLADPLLCPTEQSVANLAMEGIAGSRVRLVGDVMLDVLLHYSRRAEVAEHAAAIAARYPDGFRLATLHRAENTDDPARLRRLFVALEALAADCPVVMPLHPRTRQAIAAAGLGSASGTARLDATHLHLIEPVGYFRMLALLRSCRMVLTDSGGLQKEAYFCGKPCVTLRDETEWVELVDAGWNCLAGDDPERIRGAVASFESTPPPTPTRAPYGTGDASARIADALLGIDA
jgi:UDP-GlcNAc3NAcA epimerase